MSSSATYAVVTAALLGALVPWLGMRMLLPALRSATPVVNYRGRKVTPGLGVVWLLWSGAAILVSLLARMNPEFVDPRLATLLALAGLLALVAFALGLADDAYGTSAERGFRGHLAALAKGRLTTGSMKLFGISLASLLAAAFLLAGRDGAGFAPVIALVVALPAGAAIALTSNLANLTDLRPGRALKFYCVLATCGIVSSAVGMGFDAGVSTSGSIAIRVAVLALFAFGPVVAVWKYDLGEIGMLGDAGANPMGAVAGLMIVAGLSMAGILIYLALMLALNLASERVSFSKVIDGNRFLRWIDAVGREA